MVSVESDELRETEKKYKRENSIATLSSASVRAVFLRKAKPGVAAANRIIIRAFTCLLSIRSVCFVTEN